MNIFEEYKNNKITLFKAIENLDTYNYTVEEIKENGIVYTPKYIADYIVSILDIKEEETVLEPSVGHGVFIFSLIEQMKEKLNKENLKEWFLNKVYGFDIQETNINDLKQLLILYFEKEEIKLELDDLKNFQVKDTLFDSKETFDVIMGNPPYIRLRNLEVSYSNKLKKEFISCQQGNIDIYYAFIEFSLKYSKRSSFIVPNSYLYNKFAFNLRNIMKERLFSLIDFKDLRVFEKAGINTSIFLLKENINNTYLYKENLNSKEIVLTKDSFLSKTISNKTTKNFVFENILGPIATLRDNLYKETKNVDQKDCLSFLKLTKLKSKEDIQKNKEKIIFPYYIINDKFIVKEETDFGEKTLSYLTSIKEELKERDKGNKTYPKWFSYGRTQGLNKINNKTFIIVPGMFCRSYTFFSFDYEDVGAQFLFSSGFLIEIEKNNEEAILNFLNSNLFFDSVVEIGTVKPGKQPYYSLTKQQLEEILR